MSSVMTRMTGVSGSSVPDFVDDLTSHARWLLSTILNLALDVTSLIGFIRNVRSVNIHLSRKKVVLIRTKALVSIALYPTSKHIYVLDVAAAKLASIISRLLSDSLNAVTILNVASEITTDRGTTSAASGVMRTKVQREFGLVEVLDGLGSTRRLKREASAQQRLQALQKSLSV
ncbi:hypothetical protein PC120_g18098 [Phytophthora cactorum]|nr:hypothetical protein PC120_g18098 [Phytophthora cactorum]